MKPRIGKFRVPKVRLKILLNELNELYKKFGDKTFTITEFGNALNISETSSGLQQKRHELKNLGLLKGDDKSLKITDSGIKIVQPISPERQKEIETVVKRISLWDELQKIGDNPDDNQLFIALQNKTGLTDEILKQRFQEIKWAFTEDANCINQFNPNSESSTKPHKTKPVPNHNIVKISRLKFEPQTKFTNENNSVQPAPIIWKISSKFGDFQTEILDELSLSNAKSITMQMLDTIEKKLTHKY
jgi:hypothetical protein